MIVRQPAKQIHLNRQMIMEKDIKTFFFFKQGASKVDITLEKDAYAPDETLSAICRLDNSGCDKNIKNMKVKLTRKIIG